MKRLHLAVLLASAWPAMAVAADPEVDTTRAVTITRSDCARLVRHVAAADVAYKPGVDARGRKVAAADLPGSGNTIQVLPEVLEFNISVNPVDWAARNSLAKQNAGASAAIVSNQSSITSAKSRLSTLQTEKATLVATGTTLATQKATLDATLARLQAQVDAGTLHHLDRTYRAAQDAVTAKQAEITANTAAITANTTAQAAAQSTIDSGNSATTGLATALTDVQGKQQALSAKGFDNTSMTAAAIRYDMAKNQFSINGQPLGTPEQQQLAELCAKRGAK